MYAIVTHTDIEMDRWDEAAAGIEGVKAMLGTRNGFQGATWLGPINGHGLMISRWTDEASAVEGAPPIGFSPAPGVTVRDTEIREIIDEV
jgi:hypothetical protein